MDPVRGRLLEYPFDPHARSIRNSSGLQGHGHLSSPQSILTIQGPRLASSMPTLSSGQSYYTVESLLGCSTLPAPPASRVSSLETFHHGADAEPKVDTVPVADCGAIADRAFLEQVISHRTAFPDEAGRFYAGQFKGLDYLAARERENLLEQELCPRDTGAHQRGREPPGPVSPNHLLGRASHQVPGPVLWGREAVRSVDPSIVAAYSRRDILLEGGKDYCGSPASLRRDAMLEKGNDYSALFVTDKSHVDMMRDIKAFDGMQKPSQQGDHVTGVESCTVGAKPDGDLAGYCSVCKINCFNMKSLNIHRAGKRHKIQHELAVKEKSASEFVKLAVGNARDAVTTVSGKKRGTPEDAVTSSIVKRAKITGSDVQNVAHTNKEGNSEMAEKPKRPFPFCHLCKVTCTSQQDLQNHRKGKRHAANLQQKSH